MEEKRLECLMMLQIHRSDTPSIDAVIDGFAAAAAWRQLFNMNLYMYQYRLCSVQYCEWLCLGYLLVKLLKVFTLRQFYLCC